MGRLIPGTQYIYEKSDGITYARPLGAPISERFEIGRDWERKISDEMCVWGGIIEKSFYDEELKKELDRVKIYYYLKYNGSKT